jgi:hypothetical protein
MASEKDPGDTIDQVIPTGKSFRVGDIGSGAHVQVGEHLLNLEIGARGSPESAELTQRFNSLLQRIGTEPNLDPDARELAVAKTKAVAEGLDRAGESPSRLRQSLLDAKAWLSSTASWAWDELSDILKSEAAQKSMATITEASTKAAIRALIGGA